MGRSVIIGDTLAITVRWGGYIVVHAHSGKVNMSTRMKVKKIRRIAAGLEARYSTPKKRLGKHIKGLQMQWRPLAKRKFEMKRKGKRVSRVK